MTSTSVSSIQKRFRYDVFLSFRGEDTRKNFIDHLSHALKDKGIETYKDDENIKQGKMISAELIKAIEDSKFYIIVFSKNYASSSWCLEELVKIMECQKMTEHTAYPVFYDVEPTEVRNQSGAVGEAFFKNKNKEAAQKWKGALKEAADLTGWELKNTLDGHEAKFVKKIVQEISLELRSINFSFDEKLVGMETRVKDVVSSLEVCNNEVRMIGIKGMGGIGKTTLARAVFDQISIQFEGQSFVENVSKISLSGLKELQKQVLSDVLNDNNIRVSSVFDGKNMMKKLMCCRKVLVVLDDVDHIEQLEALTVRNWFKPGSTIIITTRDEQVLHAHGVNSIHGVNLLSNDEAILMFSRYAFGREIEIEGYKELSMQVVRYAAGLPLTIKVLGSFLCGQNEPYWVDAIERLKTIPLKATLERLEISFNGLEDDYKEIFLDVACILKGRDKENAIIALESRGFRARIGLRVLEQRSLINYDERGRLGMHDHLEEMGRNIVRGSHPDEPQRHSRLWVKEEIEHIFTNDLGTQETQCLRFFAPGFSAEIAIKGLAKMKDLKFLHVQVSRECDKNWKFDKVSEYYLPSSLRFMSWWFFPFSSLPNTFQGKHLVGLEMYESKIVQLWEDGEGKVLNNLRFLTIGWSNLRTFDLWLAPNLEQLTIHSCKNFVELHIPADHHLKLEYLYISKSKLTNLHLGNALKLKTLVLKSCHDLVKFQMPAESLKLDHLDLTDNSKLKTIHLGSTPNLEKLILKGCNDLVELEMPVESLKLALLDLSHSKLKTIHLGSTPNLEKLILKGCNDLVELEMPAESLKLALLDLSHSKLKTFDLGLALNLEQLTIHYCKDFVELRIPADHHSKLEYLYMSYSKLTNLHLGNAPNLKTLVLKSCHDLVNFQMPAESLKLALLDLSDSKVKTIHLGSTPNLEKLILKGCNDLVELKMPVKSLKLALLDLSHSKLKTFDLGLAPNLEQLTIDYCFHFVELHIPAHHHSKLEYLYISKSKLTNLHLGNALNLKTLVLKSCHDLIKFQMPAESLKLDHLDLTDNSKLKTIHLGSTPNLEKLILKGCNDLVELEMPAESLKLALLDLSHSKLKTFDLGLAPNLEQLTINYCKDFVELRIPADHHSKLEYLYMSNSKLTNLHLGNAPNLKTLVLKSCHDLVKFQMPAESLKLELLDLSDSKLKTIHLGSTPNLEKLILKGCNDLVELEMPVESLKLALLDLTSLNLKTIHLGSTPNLEKLILKGCNDLIELEMPAESLKLALLDLSHSKLKTIHLGITPNLERLILKGCNDLVDLEIPSECLKLEELYLNHSKLRTLDLGLTPNLKRLNLENCYDLEELKAPVGCLSNLVFLDLSGFGRFKSFVFDKWSLCGSLSELHLIAEPTDVCPLHSDNDSPKFQFSCYYKQDPFSSFGNLERLISTGLCACTNLDSFSRSICSLQGIKKLTLEGGITEAPQDLDLLKCLEELIFSSTKIKYLPDSICKLKHLNSLKLKSCLLLEKLPDDLGGIESLETLTITDCDRLRYIPNKIGKINCVISPNVYKRYTHGKYMQQR